MPEVEEGGKGPGEVEANAVTGVDLPKPTTRMKDIKAAARPVILFCTYMNSMYPKLKTGRLVKGLRFSNNTLTISGADLAELSDNIDFQLLLQKREIWIGTPGEQPPQNPNTPKVRTGLSSDVSVEQLEQAEAARAAEVRELEAEDAARQQERVAAARAYQQQQAGARKAPKK